MYQLKPVIRKRQLDTQKTYVRRVFGRFFTLKRMIRGRRNIKLPLYDEKIREIELQIQKLQKEKEFWSSKKDGLDQEIQSILTEHEQYHTLLKDLSERKDYTKDFDGFKLKIKPDKKNPSYKYYEGSVRGREEKGRKGKDTYFHLCSVNPRKVVRLIQRELNLQLGEDEKSNKKVLEDYLFRVLRKRWFDKISSVE